MTAGWIKINRSITETLGYFGEKFNRPMCWIDLILLAESEPTELSYRGIKVIIERGQIAISVRELSSRWSLSMPTVRKRLKEFADEHRIMVSSSRVVSIITILDYEQYQVGAEQKPQPQQLDLFGNPSLQTEQKPASKPKPQKHHYAPDVLLTDEEYGKLVAEHGKEGTAWMIQKLDDYKAARGMKYKSDYRAILNWVVREYKRQQYENTTVTRQSPAEMAKAKREADFADYIASKLGGGSVQGDV